MYQALSNEPHRQSYFLLIPACAEASAGRKAGKPELCLSIMHLCPDIRRRGGFFQRRAEGKEQVYGGQDLVLGALGRRIGLTFL